MYKFTHGIGHNTPPPPTFHARAAVLVTDTATGRPKFDLPISEYPEWARDAFREQLIVLGRLSMDEIEEYFS